MSCIKDTYMEYSIMTTNRCNLHCSYCINNVRRRKSTVTANPQKIIAHIKTDVQCHHYDPVVVTFYGGEPLMAEEVLLETIAGLRAIKPMYNLFTNGTLLSSENLPVLNQMQMISISIDGKEEEHDAKRGAGTYKKVLQNYLSIKKELTPRIIAFITLTVEAGVYAAVMHLKDTFENIFWFLENSKRATGLEAFLTRYNTDLDRLLLWWLERLKKGEVTHLIPFQGLYDILEKKHVYTGLPCGIGENFQALAIDGSIYTCEDSYHNKIGTLDEGADMSKSRHHYHFTICEQCAVKEVCGGRCVIPHLNYGERKIQFYCDCSKMLIQKFKRILPEIKQLLHEGTIAEAQLLNKLTRFTDVIP